MDLCAAGIPRRELDSFDYFMMPQWYDSSKNASSAFPVDLQLLRRNKDGAKYVPFDDGSYMLNGACYHGEIEHGGEITDYSVETDCTGTVNEEVRAKISYGVTDCSKTADDGDDYEVITIPIDDECHIIEGPYLDGFKAPKDPSRDTFAVRALKILP